MLAVGWSARVMCVGYEWISSGLSDVCWFASTVRLGFYGVVFSVVFFFNDTATTEIYTE
mgnify:CR=1 FL=1